MPSATAHATLEPRVKNISQTTIRKKWKPLHPTAQERIRHIFLSLKTKRSGAGGNGRIPPVGRPRANGNTTTRSGKTTQKNKIVEQEYEQVVEEVAERLLTRLPRMPFPASSSSATSSSGGGGAADDFDLSSTLSRTTTLQAQVSTNTASARLLQRQIARERAALRRDERELKALREGFRQSQALRRRKERGLHPLAAKVDAELDVSGMTGDDASEVVERRNALSGIPVQATTTVVGSSSSLSSGFGYFDTNENTPPNLDTVEPDSDLDPLLDQLRSHLLSMRNNTASMAPVLDAVDGAKLALDKFSARNLDEAALRRLYGGP